MVKLFSFIVFLFSISSINAQIACDTAFKVSLEIIQGQNGQINIDATTSGGTPAYSYIWSNNAMTQDLLNVTAGEKYCVTATDSDGCTTTNCITVPHEKPLNTADLDVLKSVVSPNPFNEQVTIQLEGVVPSGELMLKLMDINGRILQQVQSSAPVFSIHRNNIPSGIYLFVVSTDERKIAQGKVVAW